MIWISIEPREVLAIYVAIYDYPVCAVNFNTRPVQITCRDVMLRQKRQSRRSVDCTGLPNYCQLPCDKSWRSERFARCSDPC